jgi:single-strand DNA-binding protein
MNLAILNGRVGAEPTTRTTAAGTTITSFSLATSKPKRDSEGSIVKDDRGYTVDNTEWHRITCFNGLGSTVASYVEKGMKVMVQGHVHYSSYVDQDGAKRYATEIWAEKVDFLSYPKALGAQDEPDAPEQKKANRTRAKKPASAATFDDDMDDDVPF